jgi:uncharacterized C2H2 Zn-finger protein
MPQVIAWKCPRSGVLFDEKSAYIAHLRRLATEAMIRRPVERSFNALKKSASSVSDVCEWLVANGRACIQMEADFIRVGVDSTQAYRSLPSIDPLATVHKATHSEPLAKVLHREFRVSIAISLPKTHGKLLANALKRLGGVDVLDITTFDANSLQMDFLLDSLQWVISAKSMLYANLGLRSRGQLPGFVAEKESWVDRVLALHFPELPRDTLLAYSSLSSIVGEDPDSFGYWIDQYRDGHQTVAARPLPELDPAPSGLIP